MPAEAHAQRWGSGPGSRQAEGGREQAVGDEASEGKGERDSISWASRATAKPLAFPLGEKGGFEQRKAVSNLGM